MAGDVVEIREPARIYFLTRAAVPSYMDPVSQAWADFEHDDYAKAEQAFRRILDLPELAGEDRQQARYGLGYALAFSQQYAEARSLFLELQQESANRHDPGAQHRALYQVGMVERMAGNWAAAQETFEKERDLIAQIGNTDLAVAVNAYELGLVALHMGQSDRARAWLDLSLACAERTQDLICVGCAHRGLGDWYQSQGHRSEALACWATARAAFMEPEDARSVAEIDRRIAH